MERQRVVITGLGLVCAIGCGREAVLRSLQTQSHGFRFLAEYAEFKTSKVKIGAVIPGFDTASRYPEDWSGPSPSGLRKESLRGLNPHSFYALYSTRQALAEAGLAAVELGEETGLFTASAGSIRNIHENLKSMYTYGVRRTNPMGIVNSVVGTLTYNLASIFRIKGSSCGFASACASSAHALGFAHDEIALGRQKRIIVIGAEDGDLDSILPFAGMHALSTSSDPSAASLPFDVRRSGFVGSGGAATLILESLESAWERGAPILGEILGWGQASDGYNPAIPHPEGDGICRAMENALRNAGVTPADIAYVNAHATGTTVGDIAEAKAIGRIFAGYRDIPVSSTKALTGHTLSMAGALEASLCLISHAAGFTPGTANLSAVDPQCAHLCLPCDNRPAGSGLILSNSSGFGGANVSLVLRAGTAA
jgi:3-oxoacyl-[acyl-carrier-protein] synthase-1